MYMDRAHDVVFRFSSAVSMQKCLLQYILILFANKGTEILATQKLVTEVVAHISEKIKSCNIT